MAKKNTERPGCRQRRKVLIAVGPGDMRLNAILEVADEFGWELLAAKGLPSEFLSRFELGGAIIDHLPDSELADHLRAKGCPAVRLGRFSHPQDSLLPAVLLDLEAQGHLAAEHFAERRFQHLAFAGNKVNMPDFLKRPMFSAFCERAKELGACTYHHGFLQTGESALTTEEKWEWRHRQLKDWLRSLPKPVGVFTSTDGLGLEVCAECSLEGIDVPREVAVLGCGDALVCRMTPWPLSSVRTDELGQVRSAMLLLRQLMAGGKQPKSPVLIPPLGIAERSSTDFLAVSHPLAAKTVRYIWAHLREDPTVDEVADALGAKRRSLERIFQEHVGSGIKAEIRRRRLQVYCRELHSSDETIASLSARMGYRSMGTMHRQFVKATGTTPTEYRRRVHRLK